MQSIASFGKQCLAFLLVSVILFSTIFAVRHSAQAEAELASIPPIVFVARGHLATPDTIFKDEDGPAGQFGTGIDKYAPGSKLVLRNPDGLLMVYNTPGLIDVQSPDVSFDGTKIIFSGAKTVDPEDADYGWRLYEINVDGTGFRQLTFSDRSITIPNADRYRNATVYKAYHDLFPAYLADGRIVFNSSRYPTRSHYDQRETFNVYVMNGDGSNLHRISTERASNLHPTPLPDGRIMVSRWWNQFNQPSDTAIFNRIDDAEERQIVLEDGTILFANDKQFNPALGLFPNGEEIRSAPNTWHLMTMNTDGTDFKRVAWTPRYRWNLTDDSGVSDSYAAAQPAVVVQGGNPATYVIAYTAQQDQTMVHSTHNSSIRVAHPGVSFLYANVTAAIAGQDYGAEDDAPPWALHPAGLADGRILYSQSSVDATLPRSGSHSENGKTFALQGSDDIYRLFVMNIDGSGKTQLPLDLTSIGMATADAMDAVPVLIRSGWSAGVDSFTAVASDDPTQSNVPNSLAEYAFNLNGSPQMATIGNPNVYANPSLNAPYVNNSPPPGSVAKAEIWLDANQFTGAACWPGGEDCSGFRRDTEVRAVLYKTVPVVDGAFTAQVPADVMGFIVLRDANGRIVRGWNRGYASIAQGSSWARPGETVTCVGCHMGHVSGSLDDVMDQSLAGWTNIAPYASVSASSQFRPGEDTFHPQNVVDRRGWVLKPSGGPNAPFIENSAHAAYQDTSVGWITEKGKASGEWLNLTWPAAQEITAVRLAGPPPMGGDWDGFGNPASQGAYHVEAATLRFYRNGELVRTVNVGRIEPLSSGGTMMMLDTPVVADRVRLTVDETSGRFHYGAVAALNEIEVIGKAAESWPLIEYTKTYLPLTVRD